MSEPALIECPYCHTLTLLKDRSLKATCKVCGQDMKIVYQGEEGYEEAARDYAVLSRINKVKVER